MFFRGMRMTKTRFYDMLHKSIVIPLMGITVAGHLWLLYRGFVYVVWKRPEQKRLMREQKERRISEEQDEKEKELMLKQQEAEELRL